MMTEASEESTSAAASQHVPVLLEEVLKWLAPPEGGCVVDGTVGPGGHALRIAQAVGQRGRLIALDRDPEMLERARQRLQGYPVTLVRANFSDLRQVLDEMGVAGVDGVLLDLGVSSDQLASSGRGFSFHDPGPLDLRFDPEQGEPAHRLVNRLSAERLAELFWRYGEERYSRRIASAIVRSRRKEPIRTASQLADIVRQAVPPPARRGRLDPATRVFQALRIAVNDELGALKTALEQMPECLVPGGRLVVISFHSLEDRLVKQALRERTLWEVFTRRPLRPSSSEVQANPRARSAKLRAAQKRPSQND